MAATHVTEMADAGEVIGFQSFQHQHGIDAGVTATFGQTATKACLLTPTRSDDVRAASHCGCSSASWKPGALAVRSHAIVHFAFIVKIKLGNT
jgi:hypothetical protein